MRSNVVSLLLLLFPSLAFAATPDYHRSIRPILRQSCVGCHNPNRKAGELDLSSYASILAGSSSGKVVERGLPEDSLLYLVVTHEEEPAMPPEGDRLDDKKLAVLRTWIEFGMPENAAAAKTAVSLRPQDKPMAAPSTTHTMESEEKVTPPATTADANRLVFQSERGNAVTALAVSRDFIARSAQNQVVLFDADGQFVDVLVFPEGDVFDLHFSRDGTRLYAAGGTHAASGKVVLWDVGARERIAEYGDEFDTVLTADSTPDGSKLVFGGVERLIKVVDTKTGLLTHKLDKHTDWVFDIAINPDGLIFASADRAGNLFVWETESGQHIHTLRGHRGAITEIDCLHSEDAFVTVGEDGTVRIWDAHEGQQISSWKASNSGLLGVAVSPEDTIHTIARSGELTTWDRFGNKLQTRRQLNSMPTELESLGDKATVAIGTWDGEVQIAREKTGVAVLSLASDQTTNEFASLMVAPRRSTEYQQFDAASLKQTPADPPPAIARPRSPNKPSLVESAATYFELQKSKVAEEAKQFAAVIEELNQVRHAISDLEARNALSKDGEALRNLVVGLELQRQQAAKARCLDVELLIRIAVERAKLKLQGPQLVDRRLTPHDSLILDECQRTIARLTDVVSYRMATNDSAPNPWRMLGNQLFETERSISILSNR